MHDPLTQFEQKARLARHMRAAAIDIDSIDVRGAVLDEIADAERNYERPLAWAAALSACAAAIAVSLGASLIDRSLEPMTGLFHFSTMLGAGL